MLDDPWRVRRANKLLFADETRLEGAIGATLARPAVADGAEAAVPEVMQVRTADPARLDPDGDLPRPYRSGLPGLDPEVACLVDHDGAHGGSLLEGRGLPAGHSLV